jgi:hypothetical protein
MPTDKLTSRQAEKHRRRRVALVLAISLHACDRGSIDWEEPTPLRADLAAAATLEFDANGRLAARGAPAIAAPRADGQCTGSVRLAHDSVGDWYAVWWAARSDSTADVKVSHSTDGVRWSSATVVDSMDAEPVGCQRPPPAIVADRGNVFVVYAMAAKEGPGIFASHSMDRGMLFHSPIAVVYGDRIGNVAVAARGDTVAVAFEDPNSVRPRIALAISRTMAHLFQSRTVVSPSTGVARQPGIALGSGRIAVTWTSGPETEAVAHRMVRMGRLR